MQCVVPQVGGSSDLVCGDAQEEFLVVPPGEQQTAGRQAQDAVLLRARLQGQELQSLQATHKA